jgi:hypothetical protein
VADEPAPVLDADAAEQERSAFLQPVGVVSDAYAHASGLSGASAGRRRGL